MKVLLAQTAGFCWGVQRAVEKARKVARQTHGPVYTDGPLIHNEQVIADLQREGVLQTDDPESLSHGVLVIRAHGISAERRRRLRRLPMTLVDATCPDVARIQAAIRKYARRGYFTVIFGDPGHAEVTGLLGYTAGRGFVVTTPADVLALPDVSPVCLCAQSTQFPDDYEEIARVARTKFGDLVVLDTICDATKNRQRELQEIAAGVDAIVVVGSRQSANTLRLVELARRLKPTFHIQTREDLRKEDFRGYRTIGVTAGASTPDPVIQAVRRALEEMEECCSPSDVTSA